MSFERGLAIFFSKMFKIAQNTASPKNFKLANTATEAENIMNIFFATNPKIYKVLYLK